MKASPPEWTLARNVVFWVVLLAAILLPRVLLQNAVPVYLFSDDSHSYLLSAFHWTQTGDWETSPRRGALYSLLIAAVLRFGENLNLLTLVQHVLGAGAVAAAIATFRRFLDPRLFWPGLLIAVAFAFSAFPIFFEQAVRSEILLLLFSTAALGSWATYLSGRRKAWLLVAGVAFGCATLVKNLLLPFPFLVVFVLLAHRGEKWGARLLQSGFFIAACALPSLGNEAIFAISGNWPEPAPQSGILLYGRVAQWTALDSTAQPEIKNLIRDDIEAYRQLPKLNNNIILKRTAVPKIYRWVRDRHGTQAEVNRICRNLAVEAIRSHFPLWLEQVRGDLGRLLWRMEFPTRIPTGNDLADARLSTTKMKHQHPMLRQQEVLDFLARPDLEKRLDGFEKVTSWAWVFRWHPVLLTTLLLPLLAGLDRDLARRQFWITALGVWLFNGAIICTVGRPIPRYLMATLPIIFWVLAASLLHTGVFLVRCGRRGQLFRSPEAPL